MSIGERIQLGLGIDINGYDACLDLFSELRALTPATEQQHSRASIATKPEGEISQAAFGAQIHRSCEPRQAASGWPCVLVSRLWEQGMVRGE